MYQKCSLLIADMHTTFRNAASQYFGTISHVDGYSLWNCIVHISLTSPNQRIGGVRLLVNDFEDLNWGVRFKFSELSGVRLLISLKYP